MDLFSLVIGALQSAVRLPKIGPIIQVLLLVLVALPALCTAVMTIWQGVVGLLQGLAKLPGLSKLQGVADLLKEDFDAATKWENGFLLPLLNRLSAVGMPTVKAPAPPVA